MSGMSRNSVASLPKTGTITNTPIGQGETQTITGAKEGETWKIIGITFINPSESSGVIRLEMVDSGGNLIELSDDLTCPANANTPCKTIFTTGELIVDYNVKLQAVFVSGDAEELQAVVAHTKIN
jgi:hypothetical protein